MKTLNFSLPTGWTYSALRQFLQSELQEDKPGATAAQADCYLSLTDFDDQIVIYSLDWDGPTYQLGYTISNAGAGPDAVWSGDPIEVAQKITYVPVAEMAKDAPHVAPPASVAAFSTNLSQFALGDAPAGTDGAYVTRSGVLFEAGDYADKAAELGLPSLVFGNEELRAMVDSFAPLANRVSHLNGKEQGKAPTIFDDHMGTLERVWLDETGTKLHGTIKIPKFLDEFQKNERGGGPLQASLEIDPVTNRIVGNTIVPNPRVETSALMSACAAFSRAETPKETTVADEKVETAPIVSAAEFAALQARNAANEKVIAEMASAQRAKDAEAFAVAQLRGGKAVAAQKPYLVALFAAASEDDAATPRTANFTVGDQAVTANRVQMLEAAYASMPALFSRELIPGEDKILAAFDDVPTDEKAVAAAAAQGQKFVEQQLAARGLVAK